MSLTFSPRDMPPDIAAWGAKHLADDDPSKLIRDTLYAQYHDEDFTVLYTKDRQLAWSPRCLTPGVESDQPNHLLDEVQHVPQTPTTTTDPA
jgi:hypothetical protein